MLYGFDIGRDQWGIDVSLIPHDFGLIAASDGGTVNPYFHQQYATEKALGKRRGAYHYYRGNPAAEAAFFVANAAEVFGDGQAWCDAETFFPDLPARALAFLQEVERLTGIRPAGVYTPADFLLNRGLDWSPVYNAGYGLWEAAYVLGYQPLNAYDVPGGRAPVPLWGAPAMWQFTSSGAVTGWSAGMDLNVFYGDGAAFDAYVGGTTPQATTIQQEDDLANVSDTQLQTLLDAAARINGRDEQRWLAVDKATGKTVVVPKGTPGAWPARSADVGDILGILEKQDATAFNLLTAQFREQDGKTVTSVAEALRTLLAKPDPGPAAAAPAAVDVQALAAALAPLLNTAQVDQFVTALRGLTFEAK